MGDKKQPHICNQSERLLVLEITKKQMVERLDKFENKIDAMDEKQTKRHEEIVEMFGTMKEYVDKKYVKKEVFAVAVGIVGAIATFLGIINK